MLNNDASPNILTQACLMEAAGAQAVKAAYVQLNAYLNLRPMELYLIQAYSLDLADYPAHMVVQALQEMRQTPGRRFLPLPWEVIAYMSPETSADNEAGMIAASIVARIGDCGRTQPQRAQEKLGQIGWAVVQAMGGWSQLCMTLHVDEINTFRAQARGVAKAEIERQRLDRRRGQIAGRKTDAASLPPKRGHGLENIGEIVQHIAAQTA